MRVDGEMKAPKTQRIPEEKLMLSARNWPLGRRFSFQQDTDLEGVNTSYLGHFRKPAFSLLLSNSGAVRLGGCESSIRTPVRTKTTDPRSLLRGGLGSFPSDPKRRLPCVGIC